MKKLLWSWIVAAVATACVVVKERPADSLPPQPGAPPTTTAASTAAPTPVAPAPTARPVMTTPPPPGGVVPVDAGADAATDAQ